MWRLESRGLDSFHGRKWLAMRLLPKLVFRQALRAG
jgi:hypothetical protein